MKVAGVFLILSLLLQSISGQNDYGEYARGPGMKKKKAGGGGGLMVGVAGGVVGMVFGGWLQGRKMKKKYDKEKKELIQYIQLQEEIYKQRETQWQAEYQKLYKAYDQMEKETLERDYEEFKAPDTNNDDMISRAEFNTYVRKYLSSFPELSEKDFPKFEEFDLDGDGIVSFDEWQKFLVMQKAAEAKKALQGGNKGQATGQYNDLLNALYEQANSADSFNSLQKNMGQAQRGGQRRMAAA